MLFYTEAFIDSSNAEIVFCVNGMPFHHCESLPTLYIMTSRFLTEIDEINYGRMPTSDEIDVF